jgi:hypothetical protein
LKKIHNPYTRCTVYVLGGAPFLDVFKGLITVCPFDHNNHFFVKRMNDQEKLNEKQKEKELLKKEIEKKEKEKIVVDEKAKNDAAKSKVEIEKKISEWNAYKTLLDLNEREYEKNQEQLKTQEKAKETLEEEVRKDSLEIQKLKCEVANEEKQQDNLQRLVQEKSDENFDVETKTQQYEVDIAVSILFGFEP